CSIRAHNDGCHIYYTQSSQWAHFKSFLALNVDGINRARQSVANLSGNAVGDCATTIRVRRWRDTRAAGIA
ncbi:MAG: hypothetical protein ACREPS_02395, partial [Rhodanobacteraceae bacterium]